MWVLVAIEIERLSRVEKSPTTTAAIGGNGYGGMAFRLVGRSHRTLWGIVSANHFVGRIDRGGQFDAGLGGGGGGGCAGSTRNDDS